MVAMKKPAAAILKRPASVVASVAPVGTKKPAGRTASKHTADDRREVAAENDEGEKNVERHTDADVAAKYEKPTLSEIPLPVRSLSKMEERAAARIANKEEQQRLKDARQKAKEEELARNNAEKAALKAAKENEKALQKEALEQTRRQLLEMKGIRTSTPLEAASTQTTVAAPPVEAISEPTPSPCVGVPCEVVPPASSVAEDID